MRIFFSLGLWILAASGAYGHELIGKLLCGYQGWFRVPTDGTDNGWHHYSSGKSFEPGNCGIDLWPDVRDLPLEDPVPTKFQHEDGTRAEVFSSVRPSTIHTHFRWMREYGIDGIFLQRFAVTTLDPRFRKPMDRVLESCRTAANENGRCWALMYDLSGLKPGQADALIEDWKRLRSEPSLVDPAKDTVYLRHKGKPLVALWGFGFSDRPPMLEDWEKLIRFFKHDPQFGGCAVMLGVPAYWRTLDRDAIADPALHHLLEMTDVVSPWTVGRYTSIQQVESYAKSALHKDLEWCRKRGISYLPVAFPGFSWRNLSVARGVEAPLNQIPRKGGEFLWSQCTQFRKVGAEALYVAMFDELDEGTAIFKCRNDPPVGKSAFVSEPGLPTDHYLWLTGQAALMFRDKAPVTSEALPQRK